MIHSPTEEEWNPVNAVGGASVFLSLLRLVSWIMVPVGIILVIVGLIRYFWPRDEDPLTILQRRYAKGEISQSEFEALKNEFDTKEN